jgi:ParB-like chromosome segregation protein Spo0J
LAVTEASHIHGLAFLQGCCEQVQTSSVAMVPISSVVVSATPRSGGEDAEHVRLLAEVLADLPPIVVHAETMQLIDGLHRLRAAVSLGWTEIRVRYFHGRVEEAYLLSVAMNVTHGLPLSSVDRVAAARRIFESYPSWSDRAVAAAVGLSPRKVLEVRRSLAGPVAQQERRLRAIARQAGVAPATVADVRDRMRRGAQPVLQPRDRSPQPPRAGSGAQVPAQRTPDELFAALRSLQNDPSLRFNEVGRLVLRMLQTCAVAIREQESILATVPAHCTNQVSDLLIGYADVWRTFAVELRNKSAVA